MKRSAFNYKNMSLLRKFIVQWKIRKTILLEFVRFDSRLASFSLMLVYIAHYYVTRLKHGDFVALLIVGKIFRHTQFDSFRRFSSRILQLSILKHGPKELGHNIISVCEDKSIDKDLLLELRTSILSGHPDIFHSRLLILTAPHRNSKGVIIVKFTNYIPHFLNVFDANKLAQDYVLIVEPSSRGYFDEDILCLLSEPNLQVIIQAPEPVDFQFITDLSSNLWPVNIGANWWVDQNVFHPQKSVKKKFDIVMVSNWADVKRHYHLFKCLSRSKNKMLKIVLIGSPWPKTMAEIKEQAASFGVDHMITYFESIPQKDINDIFNKSKSYLLLSKKEGVNKAAIEALLAGIPIFMLEGFNYGFHYDYINESTGAFIPINGLTSFLDNHNSIVKQYDKPHEWAAANMTPDRARVVIEETLCLIEKKTGIDINKNIALKVNKPEATYVQPGKWDDFKAEYAGLQNYLKS